MKKLKITSLILAVVMLVSMLPLAGMISAFAAEGDQPLANDDWYTRETSDETPYELEINNAEELLAFAEKLNTGTMNAPAFVTVDPTTGEDIQMTVKLNAHIILNDGWNCMGVKTEAAAKSLLAPSVTYPVVAGAYFAGIFDGQGHVLSGLYVNVAGDYVGIFGNVPTGYSATVKNVIIKNSFIQGNGQAPGTIFGQIADTAFEEGQNRFGKVTHGYIDNVYVESVVSGTTQKNGNLGSGGFVGGSRAYLDVTNSAFVGTVLGGVRGTGGVTGSLRAKEQTTTVATYDYANGSNHYSPTLSPLTVENVYIQAHLVQGAVSKPVTSQGGAGALVGYVNSATSSIKAKDVVTCCTFGTKGYVETNGTKTEELKNSKSYTDTEFKNNDSTNGELVEERDYYERVGYLWGFTHSAGKCGMNNVPYDANNPSLSQTVFSWMTFDFTNTYYVTNTNNKVKYESFTYSPDKAETVFIINGTRIDAENVKYDEKTGVNAAGLYTLTNWAAYSAAVEAKKTDSTVKIPVLLTDVAELGYYGQVRTHKGEVQYAQYGEIKSQLALNLAQSNFALEAGSNNDWATTLATKMTGLNASEWAEYGEYLLPVKVFNMIADAKEAMDVASATPTPDADWYDNETTDSTPNALVIYNADDLLAFATAINSGKTFAGMTVTMATNVTLNKGWDAFAATVTAPATAWPMGSNKHFAGTFDGNGKTISGIYLSAKGDHVGIFGNVQTGTKAVVKNLAIVNSYVASTSAGTDGKCIGVGGLFGVVDVETTTAITSPTYVNQTKATIDGVLANINVQNASTVERKSYAGTAGFIASVRADAEITNSVFTGTVYGGKARGTAPFIGAAYPNLVNNVTLNRQVITIENCYAEGNISDNEGFVSGLIGYANTAATFNVKNVVTNCDLSSNKDTTCGYILGATYHANSAPLANAEMNPYMDWVVENLYYVGTEFTVGNDVKTIYPVGHSGNVKDADTGAFTSGYMRWNGEPIMHDTVSTAANAQSVGLAPSTEKEAFEAIGALDNWTNANGTPLPTAVFDNFYTGFVGQSVSLGAELALNIYVKTDGSQQAYEGGFAIGFASPDDIEEEDVIGVLSQHVGNNVHKFTLTGIAAYEMADSIAFSYGESEEYACLTSVQDYLVGLMDSDAELASAVLRYGAAAQVVADYKTDALVTEDIDLADEVDTTAGLTNDATVEGDASTDYFVKGVEMYFDQGVLKLKVKCFFRDITGQQGVGVVVDGRTPVYLDYRNMTPVETENRTYTAVFANIDVASINADISLVLLKNQGGNTLSQTLITDMDDIIADFLASDASAAEKTLAKAMHAIGVALAD